MALRKVIAFTQKTTPDFRAPWPLHVSSTRLGIDPEFVRPRTFVTPHLRLLHGICRTWEKSKWGKSQPSAQDKRLAAHGALLLCEKFGLPLTTTRKTGENTRASVFCRLAATLYGDPDANLQPYCRAALAKLSKPPRTVLAKSKRKNGFFFCAIFGCGSQLATLEITHDEA